MDINRLNPNMIKLDSTHHNNNQIVQSSYDTDSQRLFVLDSYSSNLILYNNDCQVDRMITPNSPKLKY